MRYFVYTSGDWYVTHNKLQAAIKSLFKSYNHLILENESEKDQFITDRIEEVEVLSKAHPRCKPIHCRKNDDQKGNSSKRSTNIKSLKMSEVQQNHTDLPEKVKEMVGNTYRFTGGVLKYNRKDHFVSKVFDVRKSQCTMENENTGEVTPGFEVLIQKPGSPRRWSHPFPYPKTTDISHG